MVLFVFCYSVRLVLFSPYVLVDDIHFDIGCPVPSFGKELITRLNAFRPCDVSICNFINYQ